MVHLLSPAFSTSFSPPISAISFQEAPKHKTQALKASPVSIPLLSLCGSGLCRMRRLDMCSPWLPWWVGFFSLHFLRTRDSTCRLRARHTSLSEGRARVPGKTRDSEAPGNPPEGVTGYRLCLRLARRATWQRWRTTDLSALETFDAEVGKYTETSE